MNEKDKYMLHYSDSATTMGCAHLTDKVCVIREYGGSYDDSWEHIMGIFTDKAKAEEFRDSYWQKVQDKLELYKNKKDAIWSTYVDICFWDMLEEDQKKINDIEDVLYRLQDITRVEVKEYPLNEIVNMYYVEEEKC